MTTQVMSWPKLFFHFWPKPKIKSKLDFLVETGRKRNRNLDRSLKSNFGKWKFLYFFLVYLLHIIHLSRCCSRWTPRLSYRLLYFLTLWFSDRIAIIMFRPIFLLEQYLSIFLCDNDSPQTFLDIKIDIFISWFFNIFIVFCKLVVKETRWQQSTLALSAIRHTINHICTM